MHGEGKFTSFTGKCREGRWENGKYVEKINVDGGTAEKHNVSRSFLLRSMTKRNKN